MYGGLIHREWGLAARSWSMPTDLNEREDAGGDLGVTDVGLERGDAQRPGVFKMRSSRAAFSR